MLTTHTIVTTGRVKHVNTNQHSEEEIKEFSPPPPLRHISLKFFYSFLFSSCREEDNRRRPPSPPGQITFPASWSDVTARL
jgi:hypothetical protein